MPEPKQNPQTPSTASPISKDAKTESKPAAVPPPPPATEIKNNAALIERAVSTLEPRFTHRVLRSLTHLRKRLDVNVLTEATTGLYPKGSNKISDL